MEQLATLRTDTRATLCLSCGKCSTMCPLAPQGWFSAARMAAIRDPESEIGGQRQALDACLTCGSCELRCPEGVRFSEFVRGLRQLAPSSERRPCPHGELLQSAARLMAGPRAPERGLDWLGDDLEVAEEGEIALFVGCLPFFDVLFERELGLETVEIARSAIRLLNRLGIQPVVPRLWPKPTPPPSRPAASGGSSPPAPSAAAPGASTTRGRRRPTLRASSIWPSSSPSAWKRVSLRRIRVAARRSPTRTPAGSDGISARPRRRAGCSRRSPTTATAAG
jgi:ferredoxin